MRTSSKPGKHTSARSADVRSDDQLDQLIHESGLRIVDVRPQPGKKILAVDLNSGTSLSVSTDAFPRLARAKPSELNAWEIIANGTAIGWNTLDEHLSLKGFLLAQVRNEMVDRLRSHLSPRTKRSPGARARLSKPRVLAAK